MNFQSLVKEIHRKKSFLCIGLDTDISKIPSHLLQYEDPIFEFNKQIIDATQDLCVAYKPNTAFYECYGVKGWQSLQKTWEHIPKNCFSIADAKRGDIGNTSSMYAQAFFDIQNSGLGFDAVTVAPYMGSDSVKPFTSFEHKWAIVLALTSNEGGKDFQILQTGDVQLYEQVLQTSQKWGTEQNMMYVVGATRPEYFQQIRKIVPHHFLLVPGVGAQGGSLAQVCEYGLNQYVGLLINSSRAIIYASNGEDFAEKARTEAIKIQQEMETILEHSTIPFSTIL